MIRKETVDKARERLLAQRDILREQRQDMQQSTEWLSQPRAEFEERAQQEKMQQGLEGQDRHDRDQLFAVNMALQRIEAGTFGICQQCGAEISEDRLLTMPWTTQCVECAAENQDRQPGVSGENLRGGQPLNESFEGLADEELCAAIREYLRHDGRVELDDLELHCHGQKVILSGALPSRDRMELLRETLEDLFGVHEIENNVHVDPEAWQRGDRPPGMTVPRRAEHEEVLEGEAQEADLFTALKEGVPVDPESRLAHEHAGHTG
jgi:RNA polymerase-binding transcription factor DksA